MFFNYFVNFELLNMYLYVPIFVSFIILLIASYYDLKLGIVPNYLSKILIIFAFIFNISLALIYQNVFYLLNSIILFILTFVLSIILWKFGFWGGGDVKIFSAISFSLAYMSLPLIKVLNLTFSIQNLKYPFIFSIFINSLLISFPFILIYLLVIYANENISYFKKELKMSEDFFKKKTFNKYFSYLNLIFIFIQNFILNFIKISLDYSKKSIKIDNLREGMILDKYYFKNESVHYVLKNKTLDFKDINLNKLNEDYKFDIENLNIISKKLNESDLFYLKSANGGGLSKEDIILINFLFDNELIKNSEFYVKRIIPFLPSLTLGYLIFIIYGDLINIFFNIF